MRLEISPGEYADKFPVVRPIPGKPVDVWSEKGAYLGKGSAVATRNSGVSIQMGNKRLDSNSIVHWIYAEEKS